MKTTVGTILAIMVASFAFSSTADAWVCRARGANSTGWGKSSSLHEAKGIALGECLARGSARCHITSCR